MDKNTLLKILLASLQQKPNHGQRGKWIPLHTIPPSKEGEPKTKIEYNKTVYFCDYCAKWSMNLTHTTEGCKKKKANDDKATLQANIAFLLFNFDEEQLFDHLNLDMYMHNSKINDEEDSTVLKNVDLSTITKQTNNDYINSAENDNNLSIFSFHDDKDSITIIENFSLSNDTYSDNK